MAGFESLLVGVNNWFGFVGSCVADGGTACRPFLAFVALTSAAGAALALLVMAYRSLRKERIVAAELTPQLKVEQPLRRAVAPSAERIMPPRAPVSGWQVPA
jgi:hypothetical protein